jgi:hypothetical protein
MCDDTTIRDYNTEALAAELLERVKPLPCPACASSDDRVKAAEQQINTLMTEIDTLQRENMELIQELENIKLEKWKESFKK